jgi:hypothetical protein
VHLENLVKAICSCGVSFSVWEKQNADGKGSGLHDFTSLMGPAKKILLEKLPSKMDGILSPETSDIIIKIWKVYTMPFTTVYENRLKVIIKYFITCFKLKTAIQIIY